MRAIEETVREFLIDGAWLDADSALHDDESLLEKGVIDSLAIKELIVFIEREYGIRVADEELMPENFDSLAALAGYIKKKQATRKSLGSFLVFGRSA